MQAFDATRVGSFFIPLIPFIPVEKKKPNGDKGTERNGLILPPNSLLTAVSAVSRYLNTRQNSPQPAVVEFKVRPHDSSLDMTLSPFQIRQANEADIHEIARITNAAYEVEHFCIAGDRTTDDDVQLRMSNGVFFLAETGSLSDCQKTLVGSVFLTF